MKYIIDFQTTQNICCCNKKEFNKFEDMFGFVTYWLKRPEILRFEITKESGNDQTNG